MFKRNLLFLIVYFSVESLYSLTGGNLYRVMMTREHRPVRLVFVRSIRGMDPETFLMDNLDYKNTGLSRQADKTIFYEKQERGKVPVLCFHRIGEAPRYELTARRTHHLMAYLVQNRFFPISDADFSLGDFSSVPSGLKPVVLGADDATRGQVLWSDDTLAAIAGGREIGTPDLDPNCLAAIFSRYFPPVDGHFNMTFYVSFDAVPFRQTGDIPHSGFPYRDLPVVGEKLRYISRYFFLGHHSVTHTYLGDQTPESFITEIEEAEEILAGYLKYKPHLQTLAYPYGLAELTQEQKRAFQRASDRAAFPEYAFDLDGKLSVLPWNRRFEPFRISRVSVDNQSFNALLNLLDRREIYASRRTILLYAEHKNLDMDSYNLSVGGDDMVYVYIP